MYSEDFLHKFKEIKISGNKNHANYITDSHL
jgi:hypothetical protein